MMDDSFVIVYGPDAPVDTRVRLPAPVRNSPYQTRSVSMSRSFVIGNAGGPGSGKPALASYLLGGEYGPQMSELGQSVPVNRRHLCQPLSLGCSCDFG